MILSPEVIYSAVGVIINSTSTLNYIYSSSKDKLSGYLTNGLQFVVSCSSHQGFSCSKLSMSTESSSASRVQRKLYQQRKAGLQPDRISKKAWAYHSLTNFWVNYVFIYKIMKVLHSVQYLFFQNSNIFLGLLLLLLSCKSKLYSQPSMSMGSDILQIQPTLEGKHLKIKFWKFKN